MRIFERGTICYIYTCMSMSHIHSWQQNMKGPLLLQKQWWLEWYHSHTYFLSLNISPLMLKIRVIFRHDSFCVAGNRRRFPFLNFFSSFSQIAYWQVFRIGPFRATCYWGTMMHNMKCSMKNCISKCSC